MRLMMNFMWHLRGSVPLNDAATDEIALAGIERLLVKQRKPVNEATPNGLAFDDPLWRNAFGPNWLAMVIYDRGRFWIENETSGRFLRYDLRSLHGMIFCLVGSMMFFVVGLASDGILRGLQLAGLAFAWLYGMNVCLALVRVPRLIRRAARKPG